MSVLRKKGSIILALSILAVVVGVFVAGYALPLREWIESLNQWTSERGFVGVIVFSGTYILGVVLALPVMMFPMASGVTYGLLWGTLLSASSATLGATGGFLISRHAAQRTV
ncbi:MAG: hypothetical protein ACK4UN_17180, partial [Limisphaerales bacterium]